VIPTLVKLFDHPFLQILIPAIRVIGNIVTGSDLQTRQVVEGGALPKLFQLLSHDKKVVRREVCWTLSNITAGEVAQVRTLFAIDGFVEKIM